MLVTQAAALMEAVKLVEDAIVIFSVTLWVTAAQIFQRYVPGKINTLPLDYNNIIIARISIIRNESNQSGTQLTSRPQLVGITTGSEVKQQSGTVGTREQISWILVATLLSTLITVITVMAIKAIYMRKKTASRDQPGDISQDCKMEGNPCYETITLRQITTNVHQAHAHDYRVFAGNTTAN